MECFLSCRLPRPLVRRLGRLCFRLYLSVFATSGVEKILFLLDTRNYVCRKPAEHLPQHGAADSALISTQIDLKKGTNLTSLFLQICDDSANHENASKEEKRKKRDTIEPVDGRSTFVNYRGLSI